MKSGNSCKPAISSLDSLLNSSLDSAKVVGLVEKPLPVGSLRAETAEDDFLRRAVNAILLRNDIVLGG